MRQGRPTVRGAGVLGEGCGKAVVGEADRAVSDTVQKQRLERDGRSAPGQGRDRPEQRHGTAGMRIGTDGLRPRNTPAESAATCEYRNPPRS